MGLISVAWVGGGSLFCSSVGKVSDFSTEGKESQFAGRVLFHFFIPGNFSKQQYTHNLSFNMYQLNTDQKIPNHELIRPDN